MTDKTREEFEGWVENTPLTEVSGYTHESLQWAYEAGYKSAHKPISQEQVERCAEAYYNNWPEGGKTYWEMKIEGIRAVVRELGLTIEGEE